MEELLKQVRSKFSGREQLGSSRERKTSVREKGPQKWLKRQLSRQMSFKEPNEEAEYAAAVAAAAFAISSLEPEDAMDQRQPEMGPQISLPNVPQFSLPRIISRIVEAVTSEPDQESETIRDEHKPEVMIPEKTIHPVPSVKRTPTMPKKRLTFADELQEDTGMPSSYIEKTPTFDRGELEDAKRMKPTNSFTRRTPSMKRTPTFAEEHIPKAEISTATPFPPPPIPPPPAVPPLNIQHIDPPKGRQRSRSEMNNTDADEWEREELAKITARYDKLNMTILEWEDKKKKKARHKLETTEVRFKSDQDSSCYKFKKCMLTKVCLQEPQNELEKKKSKALQNYQIEMERIKEIADGARAQAREKRRNEEFKVKDKANRYRETGEPPQPPVCLCL